ncbi:MAG: ribosome recycling factor, partial [Spirochaetales bacterium]|nr:ribosome recycling factor [Spirochaetales bacterium]
IKKLQKAGTISEDEQKEGETLLQQMTDSHIAKINNLQASKEKEIMEI